MTVSFDPAQALRDFRSAFLRELRNVLIIYPQAKVSEEDSRNAFEESRLRRSV